MNKLAREAAEKVIRLVDDIWQAKPTGEQDATQRLEQLGRCCHMIIDFTEKAAGDAWAQYVQSSKVGKGENENQAKSWERPKDHCA